MAFDEDRHGTIYAPCAQTSDQLRLDNRDLAREEGTTVTAGLGWHF
jgi:hypothetical protein